MFSNNIVLFADDISSNISDHSLTQLRLIAQSVANTIDHWVKDNSLPLNNDKIFCMTYRPHTLDDNGPYTERLITNFGVVKSLLSFKVLGITIDST